MELWLTETIIQKTTMSLLLESRIVTHWERVQCVGYMCFLWSWVEPCSNPRTSFPRHISWDMLPKICELWSPKLKKENGNTSAPLLNTGTWVILDFSYSSFQVYALLSKPSTTILHPTTIISNLEYYNKLWTTLPNFCSLHPIIHKTAKVIFLI